MRPADRVLWTEGCRLRVSLRNPFHVCYSASSCIPTPRGKKETGAYYTPPDAVAALVKWAARRASDRLLDPSCGDGRFIALHRLSVGVEQEAESSQTARERAPGALIHEGDFFTWATRTTERFECASGNPPFIRYQRFSGNTRRTALSLCSRIGVDFSALTSSWAPFLAATASLLNPGGRMAFVVPAEIGHATYAAPLLEYLAQNFGKVHLTALREKLFADLSEDVWLLFADDYGSSTNEFELSCRTRFTYSAEPPTPTRRVGLTEWISWNRRLRPFLLPRGVRALYESAKNDNASFRLGEIAKVGIGYVTGANDFFHLRPSDAAAAGIPDRWLHPTVRNGRVLTAETVNQGTVRQWLNDDEPVLLLRLPARQRLSRAVLDYLASPHGISASKTYKCRNRTPWFVVPDVKVPHAFLSVMSGNTPSLAWNRAGCVATNSVHTVQLTGTASPRTIREAWNGPLTSLSCEIEGHPLGGGMLKLEPREASRLVLSEKKRWTSGQSNLIQDGVETLRRWRHSGAQ